MTEKGAAARLDAQATAKSYCHPRGQMTKKESILAVLTELDNKALAIWRDPDRAPGTVSHSTRRAIGEVHEWVEKLPDEKFD